MTLGPGARRRRRSNGRVPRVAGGLLLAVVVFAAGVAVGQALEDRPVGGRPLTRVETFEPWTQTRATVTRTVTAP